MTFKHDKLKTSDINCSRYRTLLGHKLNGRFTNIKVNNQMEKNITASEQMPKSNWKSQKQRQNQYPNT